MVSSITPATGWPFTVPGVHYVYVKAGEIIAAASSAQGLGNGRIVVISPHGDVSYSAIGNTEEGHIANRDEELGGPKLNEEDDTENRYTPFTVTADEGGIWTVWFLPTGNVTAGPSGSSSSHSVNVADGPWEQYVSTTNSHSIYAWDVSVINAGETDFIPGRVYTSVMNHYLPSATETRGYHGKMFVATKDGYQYRINNNGQHGLGFTFFANNKGIVDGTDGNDDEAPPRYKSVSGTNPPVWDPRQLDGTETITHKFFYTKPDPTMPEAATVWYIAPEDYGDFIANGSGGRSEEIWLNPDRVEPSVDNIAVEGVEGTGNKLSTKGAWIKFDANTRGNYQIVIEGDGDFVDRVIEGAAINGPNQAFWDGRDGDGKFPDVGELDVQIGVALRGAEVHFPFIDVEYNWNGIIIELLDEDGEPENDIVYWDDSDFPAIEGGADPLYNGNRGDGISSNVNGHTWSEYYFGDGRTMDTWVYVQGGAVGSETTFETRVVDLGVENLLNTLGGRTSVTEGTEWEYTVEVFNAGPSSIQTASGAADEDYAYFEFYLPKGLVLQPGESVVGFEVLDFVDPTTVITDYDEDVVGVVPGTNIEFIITGADWNKVRARVNLPAESRIRFTVPVILEDADEFADGANLDVWATALRPKDYTDIDATNLSRDGSGAIILPTDPFFECQGPDPDPETADPLDPMTHDKFDLTPCNNVTLGEGLTVGTAGIELVKTGTLDEGENPSQPGDKITYTFKITNTGETPLTDIALQDPLFGGLLDAPTLVFEEWNGDGTFAGILDIGEYVIYSAQYTIDQTDINRGFVRNRAQAVGEYDDGEGDTGTVSDYSGTETNPEIHTITELVQNPELTVEKRVTSSGPYELDDAIIYEISVKNTGNVSLNNVTVNDDNAEVVNPGDEVIGLLKPGQSETVVFEHEVTQADFDAGVVINQAQVTGEDEDGNTIVEETSDDPDTPDEPNDPTKVPLIQSPAISLIKSVTNAGTGEGEDGAFVLGDEITYSFVIRNTGNITLNNITIADELEGVTVTGGPISLEPDEEDKDTFTASYEVTQADIDRGYVLNRATATGHYTTDGTPNEEEGSSDAGTDEHGEEIADPANTDSDFDDDTDPTNDPTVMLVEQSPAITLIKSVSNTGEGSGPGGTFVEGDEIQYAFKIKNTGTVTLTNITLTDDLDDIELEGEPIASLAPGAEDEETFSATYTVKRTDVVSANHAVENRATVSAKFTDAYGDEQTETSVSDAGTDTDGEPIPDPELVDSDGDHDPTNDPTVIEVRYTPGIQVIKSVTNTGTGEEGAFVVGDEIEYGFTITNTGNVTLEDIEIDDVLEGVIVSGTPIASLAPGAVNTDVTAVYEIKQADMDAGFVRNHAIVSAEYEDTDGTTREVDGSSDAGTDPDGDIIPDPGSVDGDNDGDFGNDPTVITLPSAPSIELVKTFVVDREVVGDDDRVDAGDEVTYTFEVTNMGNVTLTGVTLTEIAFSGTGDYELPDDAVFVLSSEGSNEGTLLPGETATYTLTYTLTQDDINVGELVNSTLATGTPPSGAADNVTDVSDTATDAEGDEIDDPSADGDDNPMVTNLQQTPGIVITKTTRGGEHVWIGDIITYDLVITNTGNATLTAIQITDDNADAGSISPATIAALEPGESRSATATHTLTQADIDAGYVYNIATATGEAPNGDRVSDDSHDPNPLDPDAPIDPTCVDCTITPIAVRPAVALVAVVTNTGSGRSGAFIIGDEITYRFTVTNTGNTSLSGFVLNDVKLGLVDMEVDETLAPGEHFTRTFLYTVTAEDIRAGSVETTATVHADGPIGEVATDISGDDVGNDEPTIVPIAEGPDAVGDEESTPQNTPVTVEVLGNDAEGSGDLDPATVRLIDPATGEESTEVAIDGEGTYTVEADGTITFTPVREFYGKTTIQYVVGDENGLQSDPATVTLTVVRSAPKASGDTHVGSFNGPAEIPLVANDEPDTAPLDPASIEITAQPQHGTLEVHPDGTVTYTPDQYYTGPDEFSYRVQDTNGNWTNVATVQLTVSGFNIPNVITPNGDGQNDRLVIVGLSEYDNAEVTIFNRWGNEVYRSRNYRQDWDAQGVNEGTYYYLITLKKDGRETVHKGWILVKRK